MTVRDNLLRRTYRLSLRNFEPRRHPSIRGDIIRGATVCDHVMLPYMIFPCMRSSYVILPCVMLPHMMLLYIMLPSPIQTSDSSSVVCSV